MNQFVQTRVATVEHIELIHAFILQKAKFDGYPNELEALMSDRIQVNSC